jgi:hypothetical protein
MSANAQNCGAASMRRDSGNSLKLSSGRPSVLGMLQQRLSFICHFVENEQTLVWTKLCFLVLQRVPVRRGLYQYYGQAPPPTGAAAQPLPDSHRIRKPVSRRSFEELRFGTNGRF